MSEFNRYYRERLNVGDSVYVMGGPDGSPQIKKARVEKTSHNILYDLERPDVSYPVKDFPVPFVVDRSPKEVFTKDELTIAFQDPEVPSYLRKYGVEEIVEADPANPDLIAVFEIGFLARVSGDAI